MRIMGLGLSYSSKKLLVEPMDEEVYAKAILTSLERNATAVRSLTGLTTPGATFRAAREVTRKPIDFSDPRAVGWTFLVNGADPDKSAIIDALRPLAEHRGMRDPEKPLIYAGTEEDWQQWLQDEYFSPDLERPHYVLIAGGPDMVPFRFQAVLDTTAAVGRVAFDTTEDLKTYVDKLIRLEQAKSTAAKREALFFAPVYPPTPQGFDPTYFSHRFMAKPLAEHVRTKWRFKTTEIMEGEATKQRFQEALRGARPALVYTASHGLGATDQSLAVQKRLNGAICCQVTGAERQDEDWLFRADDVPVGEPFLEGAVFFQFACFGYGTPAQSDYAHWFGKPELNADADFVAALPKRLLAHPRGPIVYIGHVDTAWLHGFDDPELPGLSERWNPRIEPFKKAVEMMLQVETSGQAMSDMNARYNVLNAMLVNTYDNLQRGKLQMTPEFSRRFTSQFITRSDAQNYMIFGDPAAHLRVPAR